MDATQYNTFEKSPLHKSGDRYGRLILTGKSYIVDHRRVVEYICDCGTIGFGSFSALRLRRKISCGCFRKEIINSTNTTHGLSHHPLYKIWAGIKTRCYNKKEKSYKNYGGRGVIMCDEWLNDFKSFYDWATKNGYKNGLELDKDKLSPEGLGMIYNPQYCCFITRIENSRNRRVTIKIKYKGEVKSLGEWCKFLGLKYTTVFHRIFTAKWSVDDSLETIARNKK